VREANPIEIQSSEEEEDERDAYIAKAK